MWKSFRIGFPHYAVCMLAGVLCSMMHTSSFPQFFLKLVSAFLLKKFYSFVFHSSHFLFFSAAGHFSAGSFPCSSSLRLQCSANFHKQTPNQALEPPRCALFLWVGPGPISPRLAALPTLAPAPLCVVFRAYRTGRVAGGAHVAMKVPPGKAGRSPSLRLPSSVGTPTLRAGAVHSPRSGWHPRPRPPRGGPGILET